MTALGTQEPQGLRVAHLERVLQALVQARRCLQLYPRTNRLVIAALEKLEAMLAMRPGGALESEELRACEIRAEGFFAGETPLCRDRSDIRRFALLLYREGAKLLRVEAAATVQEATAFLEAIQAIEDGKSSERTRAQLSQSSIRLEFFEEAVTGQRRGELPGEDEHALDGDALSYFMMQRKLRGTKDGAVSHLQDVLTFLVAAEQGKKEEQMILLNTLSDPHKIAQTLSYVTHGEGRQGESGPGGGGAGTEDAAATNAEGKADNALHQTLQHLDLSLNDYPAEFRDELVQNIGEAVLTTDHETRERIINTVLPRELGHAGIEDDITRALPPRTVSSVLMRHVQIHDGTASTIQGFVDTLAVGKRQRVLQSLEESVEALPLQKKPDQVREVERALTPQLNARKGGSAPAQTLEQLQERQRVLAERGQQAAQVTQEEAVAIKLKVAEEKEPLDVQHDMLVYFYLYAMGSLENEQRMFELLQETLRRAMEERQFDFVNLIIKIALGNVRPDVREDAFSTLQAYLLSLYGDDGMKGFMEYLTQLSKVDPESVHQTIEAIAPNATPALFHRLETEVAKQRRFDVLNILVEIGPTGMDFLRHQVQHTQWYVVRNAVFLLGRLPHEGNLPYLDQAVRHADVRVRSEALRALANTPGSRAAEIVAAGLRDQEVSVRHLAAETLGRMGNQQFAGHLVALLDEEGRRLLRQPDYALDILQAIAKLASPSALPSLRRFMRRTWLPGTIQRPKLRATCRFAQSQARNRHAIQHGEAVDDTVAGR